MGKISDGFTTTELAGQQKTNIVALAVSLTEIQLFCG